jgi:hypothetical protein
MGIARRDHQTLTRIAPILVALAVLAERAGGRSFPVRWFVLTLLWHAEAVADGYVAAVTQTRWQWPDETAENRPLDAAILAWRLRVLAAAIGALLRASCLFSSLRSRAQRDPLHRPPLRFAVSGGRGLIDTS